MTAGALHLVVPGSLEQRTGGYLYDARMVEGLRGLGWRVDVHGLPGSFPDVDARAREAMEAALASAPDDATIVLDGLAMGALPEPLHRHAERLRLVALLHHPLADETGVSPERARALEASERDALAACLGAIVTSPFTARRLADFGVQAERVRAVLPGTEPAPQAEGPGPGAPPRLVCVGTVTPRKGHDVLVGALERLCALPWTCVCAGSLELDPEHAGGVRAQVRAAGLAERVDFVGEKDASEVAELYRTATIFVLASHYEGYGMALAEALARGLPVVSTTGGAIPHTVPADAGILVEPGDVGALAEALRSALAEPGVREALVDGARRHAAELPSWDDSVRAFARAVEELSTAPAARAEARLS